MQRVNYIEITLYENKSDNAKTYRINYSVTSTCFIMTFILNYFKIDFPISIFNAFQPLILTI